MSSTDATEAIASGLDTQTKGIPVVVYNPLNIAREDIVEASVAFPSGTPKAVRVSAPTAKKSLRRSKAARSSLSPKCLLSATPSTMCSPPKLRARISTLKVTDSSLENARYRVQLEPGRRRLQHLRQVPQQGVALGAQCASPSPPTRPSSIRPGTWIRSGAGRAARLCRRPRQDSHQRERPGPRLPRSHPRDAKAQNSSRPSASQRATPAIASSSATRSTGRLFRQPQSSLPAHRIECKRHLQLGRRHHPAAQRFERQFEVASHRWIDLTDKSGSFGTTILTDCKNGSDKPNDNTLRLTLMRSPGMQPPDQWPSTGVHRSGQSGLGTSRNCIWPGRTRRRLAQVANRLASLSSQRSADSLREQRSTPARSARASRCFT